MALIDELLEQLKALVEAYILAPTPALKLEIELLKAQIEALLPLSSTVKVGLDLINFALDLPSPTDVQLLQIIIILWEILFVIPIPPILPEYPYANTKEDYEALNSAYIGNHEWKKDRIADRAERIMMLKTLFKEE